MFRAGVSKKGQVTLPAEVRKHLNIKPGAHVYFVIEDNGVRITPAGGKIDSLKGIIKAAGPQDFTAARRQAMEEMAHERISKNVKDN